MTSMSTDTATTGNPSPVRLTELAHGGGCGCKISPAILRELLRDLPGAPADDRLLVGNTLSDDAAVWAIDDDRCLISTTDFFMPVVDDPHHFGQIAATNALSDIYAMGGRPLFALAIVGMPLARLGTDTMRAMLAGGAAACAKAGIAIVGGHSIDTQEPIYGLAVTGECARSALKTNADASGGDVLILTKPLGVGIYSAALKRGALDSVCYDEMLASTTQLNDVGATLGMDADVRAITDVTGFGLLGHGLEVARASDVCLRLHMDAVPLFEQAEKLARAGVITGASERNWASLRDSIHGASALEDWRIALLTDPQTSGGLLLSVARDSAERVLALVRNAGFTKAAIIGEVASGEPGIHLIPRME